MRPLLAVAVLLSLTASAAAEPQVAAFDTPAEALRDLLAHQKPAPRVLAFGEVHETTGAVKTTPAIRRFADEMIAAVPGDAELLVETWVQKGQCGAVEKQVVAQVAETTKRPETVETDIVRLMRLGKARGMRPHILELDCPTYNSLQDDKGQLDAVKLLGVVTRELEKNIVAFLKGGPAPVVVYGGALHNDKAPRKELAEFSFARAIDRAAKGRYLELDLYVPEYVEGDAQVTGKPYWKKYLAEREKHPTSTIRVKAGPGSYVFLFPRAAP